MIQATLCFIFRQHPQPGILLGFKKRGFGVGKFDGFGGKLQQGETHHQAALREVYEESGLMIDPIDLLPLGAVTFIFPNKPTWDHEVHVYTAHKWHGAPVESEEMRPEWFSLAELPFQHMWDDSHYWLPHVLQDKPIRATFIFKMDNQTVGDYSIRVL